MSHVTITDPLFTKLQAMFEPVEVRDAQGALIGHFVPASAPQGEDRLPKISEAEMDRREREGGGRPLSAILADLERQG
jgi:hypothetical protein